MLNPRLLSLICVLVAVVTGGRSGYISAKAILSQHLLEIAWTNTLQQGKSVKPWAWADTWPVARLEIPFIHRSLIVLEGSSGEAMAFGPGRLAESSHSAESGVFILGGHRDTHLAFLEQAQVGTRLNLQTLDKKTSTYRVADTFILDTSKDELLIRGTDHGLVLITCYPFNAMQTGGVLRYVVTALPIEGST